MTVGDSRVMSELEARIHMQDTILAAREVELTVMKEEVKRLREYAKEASKAMAAMVGHPGSEAFTQIGEDYYASPSWCLKRHHERQQQFSRFRKGI